MAQKKSTTIYAVDYQQGYGFTVGLPGLYDTKLRYYMNLHIVELTRVCERKGPKGVQSP